jgi:nucleolar MIF4G domain-containing protein 1
LSQPISETESKKAKGAPKPESTLAKLAERSSTSTSAKPAPASRSERERQDDAYIDYLEKKLGWKKGKDKTKSYGSGLDEDGLAGT